MYGRILLTFALATTLATQAVLAEGETAERERESVSADEPSAIVAPNISQLGPQVGAAVDLRDLPFRRPSDRIHDAPGGLFTAFGVGMFASSGADLLSTEVGLRQAGVYESNPLQGNRNVRLLTHAAAPAFMYWVTDRIHKGGKPKLALLARIGFTVAYSYAVMHNLRTTAATP